MDPQTVILPRQAPDEHEWGSRSKKTRRAVFLQMLIPDGPSGLDAIDRIMENLDKY